MTRKVALVRVATVAVGIVILGGGPAQARDLVFLRSSVIAAAGAPGIAGSVHANGTLAQSTPTGIGTAEGVTLHAGFWRPLKRVSGVDDAGARVTELTLGRPWPNPSTGLARIALGLPGETASEVILTIHDVTGRKIRTLADGPVAPGMRTLIWDGRDERGVAASAGAYFAYLRAQGRTRVERLFLLR